MNALLQPLIDMALAEAVVLVAGVLASLAIAAWARVQVWARRNLGLEFEALNRAALDQAIDTGIKLVLNRKLTSDQKIDAIVNYVQRSTPDAIAALRAPIEVLRQKAQARLEDWVDL